MADTTNLNPSIVRPANASAFQQARQRLRAARMKWIDENEIPVAMEYRDMSGKAAKSPFLTGCITATPEEIFDIKNEKPKPYLQPGRSLSEIEDELDETIREYLAIEGVAVSGKPGDKVAYVNEASYRERPPILEGETHEEWFNRTAATYTQEEKPAAEARRTGADTDDLRGPGEPDPGDGRPVSTAGAEDSHGELSEHLRGEPNGDDSICTVGGSSATPTGTDSAADNGSATPPGAAANPEKP